MGLKRTLIKTIFLLILGGTPCHVFAFLEMAGGYTYLSYTETHPFRPNRNEDFTEHALNFSADLKFSLLNIFQIGVDVEYIGPSMASSDSSSDVSILNQNSKVIMLLPAEPFNIGFQGDYFYHDLYPSKPSMGYEAMDGIRYSIVADFKSAGGNILIYGKFPLWMSISDRQEYYASITLTGGGGKKEGDFYRGPSVKFSYSQTSTEFEGINTVTIEYQTFSLSFGYGW